jgi:hypothetical protein
MSKYIGRLVNVGFGIEAVRGTAVSVQRWQPKTDLSFDETPETVQDESSVGVLTASRGTELVRKFAEGDIGGNVEANSVGYLLLAVLGAVSTTETQAGEVYSHEFTLAQSNAHQSLTIGIDDPVIGDKAFALAMVESFTLTAENGQIATFSVTFKAKPGESASHTVTYAPDNLFLSRHSVFKVAENLAGLNAASAVCLQSFEVTFTKNLEDHYCLGSLTPADFVNKQFSVEGSFTAVFDSTTFRDFALAGTQRAARFQFVNSDVTIGTASNPSMTIDMALVGFREFSRSQGNDEMVTQTVEFTANHSLVDSETVTVTLVNETADYEPAS